MSQPPQRHIDPGVENDAAIAVSSSSSSSVDAYDQQDVSSVLPPSRRGSADTRSIIGTSSALSWMMAPAVESPHQAPSGSAVTHPRPLAPWEEKEDIPSGMMQGVSSALRFIGGVGEGGDEQGMTTGPASTSYVPLAASAPPPDPPSHVQPFRIAVNASEEDGTAPAPEGHDKTRYEAASEQQRARSAEEEGKTDASPAEQLSFITGEDPHSPASTWDPANPFPTRPDARRSSSSHTIAEAAPSPSLSSGNGTAVAEATYDAAPPHAVAAALHTSHVRFSSDLDFVEVNSRTSTVATNPDAGGGGDDVLEMQTLPLTPACALDNEDENNSNGDRPGRRGGSGSGGRSGGGGSAPRSCDRVVTRLSGSGSFPSLLSVDELQLARLQSLDRAGGHGGQDANSLVGTGSADGAGGHGANHSEEDADADVTTLDFLRDTTTTILPDAFMSMFASTTHFLKSTTAAAVHAVPQPLRRAAKKTGDRIASAADATGAVLSNVSLYAMRGVPDKILSPEWKYLVFVDAVQVVRCSLNVHILVAPYIFRMAGLVGGLLLIMLVAALCEYYTEVFFRAKNELRRSMDVIMYGDVPRLTFGRWYPTFQLCYDEVTLVAMITYAALNAQALFSHMGISASAGKTLSFIFPSLFAFPLTCMKRARTQPPMMTLASLLIFVSLIMIFTVFPYGEVVRTTINTIAAHAAVDDTTVAVLHLFPTSAQEFVVALCICVYVFTPLTRAVPVERTMEPQRYIRLFRVAQLLSVAVYIVFGVCAIVSYGSLTCSVLSTSFHGHNTNVEVAVMSLLFIAFVLYIPLCMFEMGELCDRRVLGWRSIPHYADAGPNFLRVLMLVGSAVVSWCMPYYGLLISLAGCFGYSVVGLIVPAVLDYVSRMRHQLLRGCQLRWWEYGIVFSGGLFGSLVFLAGMVMTFYEMWLVVQSGYSTTC